MVIRTDSKYQRTIYSPRTMGYFLIRIVLKSQDSDVEVVNKIHHGFITGIVARCGKPIGPGLKDDLFAYTSSSQVAYLLTLTARFDETVPPTSDEPHKHELIGEYGENYNAGAADARFGYLALTMG